VSDDEFLAYCEGMTETERCGFVPANIARLLRLAGHEKAAAQWDAQPLRIVSNCHEAISRHVKEARSRIKEPKS
jgi:hypothetical protein